MQSAVKLCVLYLRVSYFAFTRGDTGYSGVATFCRKDVTVPITAQEGLTGILNYQPGKIRLTSYVYAVGLCNFPSMEELGSCQRGQSDTRFMYCHECCSVLCGMTRMIADPNLACVCVYSAETPTTTSLHMQQSMLC